jgi:rod shape determining protein RodA
MKLTDQTKKKFVLDLKIFIPMILISFIGIISLLSTTVLSTGGFGDLSIVWKQIIFVIIGLIAYFLISFLDLSYLKNWQIILLIYLPTLLLLLATLIIGPTINNVKRWLVVGGIQIQPSEIAKFVVIVLTASIISLKNEINQWVLLGISFLLSIIFFVLIYMEPDGSMSLLTMALWFLVAFFGMNNLQRNSFLIAILGLNTLAFLISSITGNWIWMLLLIVGISIAIFGFYYRDEWKKYILITLAISLLVGGLSTLVWEHGLRKYQKDRIEAFFNPEETEDDIGFNVNQARISIGSGQILGKGFGNGTQSKRDFLPEHQTDFIFASFAEEFGLVGSLLLLILYGVIIINSLFMAMNTSDNTLYSLICLGITFKILLEVFINIGTNTGVLPATGIPLPLMTAGGSVTIMTMASLGLVQNISSRYNLTEKNVGKNILEDF